MVEGHTKIFLSCHAVGIAFIRKKYHRMQCSVVAQEIPDFLADLTVVRTILLSLQPRHRALFLHRDTAFIDDFLIFFLEFHEYGASRSGLAIAAQTQLFLIDRLFDRMPRQPVIVCIKIKTAYRRMRIPIWDHMRMYSFHDCRMLLFIQKILKLISSEYILTCHNKKPPVCEDIIQEKD